MPKESISAGFSEGEPRSFEKVKTEAIRLASDTVGDLHESHFTILDRVCSDNVPHLIVLMKELSDMVRNDPQKILINNEIISIIDELNKYPDQVGSFVTKKEATNVFERILDVLA